MASCTVPAVAMSVDCKVTSSLMLLKNAVARFDPLTVATDVFTKLTPFTIIVADPLPARTLVGETERICGTGAVLGVTVNVCSAEVPPPGAGVKTVIEIVPGPGISPGWTMVVNSVWLKKMVCRCKPLNRINEDGAKPEPITWSVNWTEPATTLDGLSEVTTGVGRLMTPPHELSASAAARKISFRILCFGSKLSPFPKSCPLRCC